MEELHLVLKKPVGLTGSRQVGSMSDYVVFPRMKLAFCLNLMSFSFSGAVQHTGRVGLAVVSS